MAQYEVVFEDFDLQDKWPAEHKVIFQTICDMDAVFYRQFIADPHNNIETKRAWTDKIKDIKTRASDHSRHKDNESTWRSDLEHKILARLDSRMSCSRCRTIFRRHEHQQLPSSILVSGMERLETDIDTNCKCEPSEDLTDETQPTLRKLFDFKSSTYVREFPEDGVKKKSVEKQGVKEQSVKKKQPDRIHGISKTATFELLTSQSTHETHSPFTSEGVIYPFLVVEAKSEKRNPGFVSMQEQTNLPIRIMLYLQTQLKCSNGPAFRPLVWFIAYAGPIWRIYGCVVDKQEKLKISAFPLWEGSILCCDKIFRLLLIIDQICQWALKFRETVYHCLQQKSCQPLPELRSAITTSLAATKTSGFGSSKGSSIKQNPRTCNKLSAVAAGGSDIDMLDTAEQEIVSDSHASMRALVADPNRKTSRGAMALDVTQVDHKSVTDMASVVHATQLREGFQPIYARCSPSRPLAWWGYGVKRLNPRSWFELKQQSRMYQERIRKSRSRGRKRRQRSKRKPSKAPTVGYST